MQNEREKLLLLPFAFFLEDRCKSQLSCEHISKYFPIHSAEYKIISKIRSNSVVEYIP